MDCNEARHHWNLYHDSEGDPQIHLAIEEHLARCPTCAEWFKQQSRLEGMLADKLREGQVTPVLWNRVLDQAGVKPRRRVARWFWIAGVPGIAAAILIGLAWFLFFRQSGPDLDALSADWHERLSTGKEPIKFASRSDEAVDKYLREDARFPVRCPPRKDAGFEVRGAGVGTLAGHPAAYITGEVDSAPVSIFVLPREALASFPRKSEVLREKRVVRSRTGNYDLVLRHFDQNAIVVIGRTDPAALERVAAFYGAYPHEH